MFFPELNEIISELHTKKSRAIENLDFEKAEELQNAQKKEINRRSELQAKHISDCALEEFNRITTNRNKSLILIDKKYENSKKEIEDKFTEIFKDAQKQQESEVNDIEDQLQAEIKEEKLKPIPRFDELIQQANKQARMGNIQESKSLKIAADRIANEDIQNRCNELTKQFDVVKEEILQKHAIEARNIINLKNSELKEIEKEKIKNFEKTENQYKASLNALKSKCIVQCKALSGDSNINMRYSDEIIQNIESLENQDKNSSKEQEKIKASQKLKKDTLTKTLKIINGNNINSEKPEEYLKRTAKIIPDEQQPQPQKSNVRYLSKSFFTTQNANIF